MLLKIRKLVHIFKPRLNKSVLKLILRSTDETQFPLSKMGEIHSNLVYLVQYEPFYFVKNIKTC